jgi:catechol 2,3-dioxygenase-like lactoylglutathione lyase family enzyme
MANERTYPALPCKELDESIAFYESIGFKRTYRQLRPNPYAVVALEDIHIHLFGMDNFNPADSYGTTIIAVPDPDSLYRDFASRLRSTYGKLPVTGIPRITRPRKKYGTVSGFSVVDPGGNWLRIYKLGDTEEEDSAKEMDGLAGFINVAARLGDARGDEALALKTLETGIKRFPEAPAIERAKAYLYRAELAVRVNNIELAKSSLIDAKALDLSEDEVSAIADELAHVTELVSKY